MSNQNNQEQSVGDDGKIENLEAGAENKGFETAKALISKKFADAGKNQVVFSTSDFVGELMSAGVENFTVEDLSAWFQQMKDEGYDVKPLTTHRSTGAPISWKIVSAPEVSAEALAVQPQVEEAGLNAEEPPVAEAAVDKAKELREARLAALEEYISSLREGAEFTGKDATTALQDNEKLEKPSNARVVALLAQLQKAGKIKHLEGDNYVSVAVTQEPGPSVPMSKEQHQLVVNSIAEHIRKGEFKADVQILDILAANLEQVTPAILRDGLAAAGIEMSLASVKSTILPALVAQGLVAESQPGTWAVNQEKLAEAQGQPFLGPDFKQVEDLSASAKREVKNDPENFVQMVEALSTLPDETDVEGVRAAFAVAGLAGTMEETVLALPGLAADGLIKEINPGTWAVNRAEVAKRQKSVVNEVVAEKTETEKLQEARIKAVEAYIDTQADAGNEITQTGALAALAADAAMGDVTDLEVFKIFEDLERAGKIKFISNGKYERITQEIEEEDAEDAEAKKQELFEARLLVLEDFIDKAIANGDDITIATAKSALEAEGDLGADIPETEVGALLAHFVADGVIQALPNGKYEGVSEEAEASVEFTPEQLAIAHQWLKRAVNRPGVRYVDEISLSEALHAAGFDLAVEGVRAILAQLAADGLIKKFPSVPGGWSLNRDAIRDLEVDESDEGAESAAEFYRRAGIGRGSLLSFTKDVLKQPVFAARINDNAYNGEQLQVIFEEYKKYLRQGAAYQPPVNGDAWDELPSADVVNTGNTTPEEEEAEEDEVEEERPGFFKRVFGGKKKPKKSTARTERVETISVEDQKAWKESRRGKSFINSLTELNGDLALGGQDYFDPESEVDIEQAITAQEMFDTHYAKVRNIFDRQLEAMTGYSMYDIFNLGPEGEKMYEDFGKWVVRQAYLDAGTPQGRGRLEKIISLDASVQEKSSFLATVVSPKRLQELQDKRDDWKTAYKITRVTSGDAKEARDRLGKAVPTSWFAEIKGIRTARRWGEYVQEVEENFDRAPEVKAKIEKQRQQIIAELDSMNGLLDAEQDKTSPASGFAKMLRNMINKIGSTETPTDKEPTLTEREKAEQAEQVLKAVKKVQAQREAAGVSAYAFYDEQMQNKADFEIRRLEANVTNLVQKEFAKTLKARIQAGKAKGIIDFRAETIMTIERLAGNLAGPNPRRDATVAIVKVLEDAAQQLANVKPEGPNTEVLKELENSITLLRKRSRT